MQTIVKTIYRPFCFALLSLLLTGCSASAGYRIMQETAKQNCQKQPPTERDKCEARIDKEDYETYEKNRSQ